MSPSIMKFFSPCAGSWKSDSGIWESDPTICLPPSNDSLVDFLKIVGFTRGFGENPRLTTELTVLILLSVLKHMVLGFVNRQKGVICVV